MRQLSIREMRAQLGRLDRLLAAEGEIVVTRHGRPVARIVPLRATVPRPSHEELRRSMPPLKRTSEEILRADRDPR